MWAQGMDDFKPLRTVPGLAEALMTLGAPNSVAAQGGTPRPAMDVTKGRFFRRTIRVCAWGRACWTR